MHLKFCGEILLFHMLVSWYGLRRVAWGGLRNGFWVTLWVVVGWN